MIESLLFSAAQSQGIVAILLVFFIVRSETQQRKCLDKHYEMSTRLLIMVGDILCDHNDEEQCRKFDAFKGEVENRMSLKRS